MIEEADRELLRKATANLTGANAVIQFVSEYLRDKYRLPVGAVITPYGEIVLPPPKDQHVGSQLDMFLLPREVAVSREANGGNECLSEKEEASG